jgi:glutaredoxin-like protein NrdH
MTQARGTVRGKHAARKVAFYGISTCIWCKRTRALLEENDVQFDFTYMDLVSGDEQGAALREVARWNPSSSFPTVVIDDATCIVGYQPDKLKEALGL